MAIDDTGWKRPDVAQTPEGPKGLITPAVGTEPRPCYLCRSWEKDKQKLIQFFVSRGFVADSEGIFETPIVRDFKGRRSIRVDPRNWGYCRRECIPTEMNATCPDWELAQHRSELMGKI